jgi:hypothetical protein
MKGLCVRSARRLAKKVNLVYEVVLDDPQRAADVDKGNIISF